MMQPIPSSTCSSDPSIADKDSEQELSNRLPDKAAVHPNKSVLRSGLLLPQVSAALCWQASTSAQSLPLRGRDLQALKELFIRSEIEAIESDILRNLDWRCPEPCWEDDPFEFLREYL